MILAYLVEPVRASAPLALSLQAMESMRSTLIHVYLAVPAQAYVLPVQSARANCYIEDCRTASGSCHLTNFKMIKLRGKSSDLPLKTFQDIFLTFVLTFHIRKFGIFRQPYQIDGSDRTVSLLGNDDLGNTFIFCILVVVVITINEHHDIRILLDRS